MSSGNTKKLLLVIIVLVIYVYLRYYLTPNSQTKIVQVSLTELTPSLLLQKNPIVIEERLVNPLNLVQTAFKYLYMFKKIQAQPKHQPDFTKNTSRYLLIMSNRHNSSVEIRNPTNPINKNIVDVRLHANMCLILPFKWWYRFHDHESIQMVHLDDILSYSIGHLC